MAEFPTRMADFSRSGVITETLASKILCRMVRSRGPQLSRRPFSWQFLCLCLQDQFPVFLIEPGKRYKEVQKRGQVFKRGFWRGTTGKTGGTTVQTGQVFDRIPGIPSSGMKRLRLIGISARLAKKINNWHFSEVVIGWLIGLKFESPIQGWSVG